MDEDIIEDIADALSEQLSKTQRQFKEIVMDDIIAMAIVINAHQPTYDMRYFYKRTGYPEPYPQHDMHY